MALNRYPVAVNFPNGLLLDLLIQEMPDVWPASVFPVGYAVDGRPRKTLTAGLLEIETARELTAGENGDAIAQFILHNPANGAPQGVTRATLPPASVAGDTIFISDLDRATGPGAGTMAYSDGIAWRRVADDELVN